MRTRILIATSYILATAGGVIVGMAVQEERAYKKYEESLAAHKRAIDIAQRMRGDCPVPEEGDLVAVTGEIEQVNFADDTPTPGQNIFTGELQVPRPAENAYHKAIEATVTSFEQFVEGGVNDYGVSYIEEEEFQDDEDGRFKAQIIMVMAGEHDPVFFMDGVQIDDWDKRLGDSIWVDFTRLVPPGAEQVLYVRNHKTDEDYEVIRELP